MSDQLAGDEPEVMSIDEARFRTVLGHFCSGIVVVTGLGPEGQPAGLTCQSFISVSLDPPLVAFCPSNSSKSYPLVRHSGRLCINVLEESQEDLSRVFATSGGDKFREVGWRPGAGGAPQLNGALAWIECEITEEHPAGDHVLVVARVKDLGHGGGKPLLFYRGGYGRFEA